MTRFEEIGVEIQYSSTSKRKAQRSFRYSCNVCCNRGMHIDCDRCAIAYAHKTVVESFEALEALAKVHATGFSATSLDATYRMRKESRNAEGKRLALTSCSGQVLSK